jgi:hypothetical protein
VQHVIGRSASAEEEARTRADDFTDLVDVFGVARPRQWRGRAAMEAEEWNVEVVDKVGKNIETSDNPAA